ncbi:MAG TPA: chemotaxis protein CheW [Haliangiales bacterium]|nr:chemotaxis protein CheW [Haliangiales bacterium]
MIELCTFRVGPLFLGIEVARVQEVLRHLPIVRVPLAAPAIRGLINLRGQIVTAIDLRRRLGLADTPPASPANVVVRTPHGPVSLVADDVGEVLGVSDEDFAPPPETLRGPSRALYRGAYKLPGELLLHLVVDEVVRVPQ